VKQTMSSRDRIRATVAGQPVDHTPICFDGICHGSVAFLSQRYPDPFERARYFLSLGIDTAATVSPPLVSSLGFETREWVETPTQGYPLLHKEYVTPRGTLRQVVRQTEDYPHASIPLFSDHNVPPGRTQHYLVGSDDDLGVLEHILRPPQGTELDWFAGHVRDARRFCDTEGVLLVGYSQGVGDPLIWLSGIEPLLLAAVDTPAFVHRYVDVVARWDRALTGIMLDAGAELIVRRGWYESTDFWSPSLFREFLLEPLRRDAEMVHQAGALLTYVMNSGAMPLLSCFREAGVDIWSNVDPQTPNTDLGRARRELGHGVALCGGVNNSRVLEQGTEQQVERAVMDVMETLAPDGGFILAPGDALLRVAPQVEANFHRMVETWRRLA
jgi:hypothetical protein